MNDSQHLAQEIQTAWDATRCADPALPDLPDSASMERMLEAAFWASMRTEEKRTLSFRLAYCTPKAIAEEMPQRPPVHFSVLKPLTTGELVRLSPALDYRQALVGVCLRRELEDDEGDELVVWGIVDSGMSWWEHTKGEPKRRVHFTPPPNCFTVSSYHPGAISVSCRGRILLSLRDGKVSAAISNILHKGVVGSFFQEHARKLVDDTDADFTGADGQTRRETEEAYVKFLERLLSSMREFAHGGTVLFVPDHWTGDAQQVNERLLIKFPTYTSSTWEILKDYLQKLSISLQATDRAVSTESVERQFFLDFMVTRHQRDQSEDLVRERASLLASLTRVDGCILLTRSLDLVGFGVEIIWPAPDLDVVYLAQDTEGEQLERIPIHHFGTRHRSAFRFCHSHQGVLAMILSSDGDVRVVRQHQGRVVIWTGLESPELGL